MIDTDKYEGHKEGPWKIYYDKWERTGWYIASIATYNVGEGDDVCKLLGVAQHKNPTANLIADAPLLLEEVKRLREQNKLCFDTLMHWLLKVRDSHWDDKEHVLERIEEGYDLETMIHIYEARVDMTACSIEQDILVTLKEMVE